MERKTADDVRFCEVVQDLLPLYVDGALKRGSMELVEEHLKTCADCRDRLNRMREPLALDAAAAKPVTKNAPNMTAKRAFKKVRSRMRMVICVCLAILLAIPACILVTREAGGSGLCISSYGAWKQTKALVNTLGQDGVDAFVAQMEPTLLYQDHITPVGDTELCDKLGIPYVLREDETWVSSLGLLGETYYMRRQTYRQYFTDDVGGADERAVMEAYQAGDEERALELLLLQIQKTDIDSNAKNGPVLTEELYQKAKELWGDELDMERYFPLELYGETYYVFVGSGSFYADDSSGGEPVAYDLQEQYEFWIKDCTYPYISDPGVPWRPYPDNVLTVVPDAPEISIDFILGCSAGGMLPEKLYRKLSQDYQKIRQTYDAYTQYYVDLGYEAFRDEWRQDMVQLLNSIDLACFNAKPLDLSDAKNGNWRATYWCNAGRPYQDLLYMQFYSDGTDTMLYTIHSGGDDGPLPEYASDAIMRLNELNQQLHSGSLNW